MQGSIYFIHLKAGTCSCGLRLTALAQTWSQTDLGLNANVVVSDHVAQTVWATVTLCPLCKITVKACSKGVE